MDDFDVAIVGGGLVGVSLAVALADLPLRIVLLEAAAPPASAPAWDERCIALNDASRRIFESLGIWDAVATEAEPIRATHVSERGRFGVARFEAADAGLEALGYNVPLRAIGAALWQRLRASRVELRCPARVTTLAAGDAHVELRFSSGAGAATLRVRLLAAADGADSAVRAALGIGAEVRDYAQQAVVSAVRLTRPHRGVAYERFTAEGPLALIPKPGDAASLVWTLPTAAASAALALGDEEYLARAQEVFGGRLGRFAALGRRSAHPLRRVVAKTPAAARVVLLGNAAQSLHPVAAQGFNLGLRDVAALAAALRATPEDPGAASVLAGFAEARASDRRRVSDFTDFLVRSFSNRVPGLAQARHWGLVAADLLPGARERLLRQHLGHFGLLPSGK